MKTILKILFLFLLFVSVTVVGQETIKAPEKYTAHNKGKFFVTWGGNRDKFTKSDIHFKGADYDFTLYDVKSHDVPKGWHVDYINPTRMSIPQTNFQLGYFITDHYSVSIGEDHMKYVMTQNQVAVIKGNIGSNYPDFAGTYPNNGVSAIDLSDGKFLKFEHTNGLNYVNINVARVDDISKLFRLPNTDKFQINITEGIGGGFLYPRTDATLLGMQRHDEFHVAGYGFDAKAGFNFIIYKYFFLQTQIKGGYINMTNIQTTYRDSDSASQHFLFFQTIINVGANFRI